MREIEVSDEKNIGDGRVFVVAEIGSNHEADLSVALESIGAAASAGADAVKFQSIDLEALYHDPTREVRDLHKKIDLPEHWYRQLKTKADDLGLIFLSSPTYLDAVDLLESIDVTMYKLASIQVAVFPQIVEKVARTHKPVILSTGMSTEEQLSDILNIFQTAGNDRVVILHCNSMYPATPDVVHIPRMNRFRSLFGKLVGFSDHTQSNIASIVAVAHGACVIERHMKLSDQIESPDADFSLNPEQFRKFVEDIREAEKILVDSPRDHLEDEERKFRLGARYFLVTCSDVKRGELLDSRNISFKRGGCSDSIEASWFFNNSQNARFRRDLSKEDWISLNDLDWLDE